MEFLGHKVGNGQMMIPCTRAKALLDYMRPSTKRALRSLLGAVSFYRRYLEQLVSHTTTLSPATSNAVPGKVEWTKEMESAFHLICESISNACSLTIPLPEDEMSIVTNAAGSGIGGGIAGTTKRDLGSSSILLPPDQGIGEKIFGN